MADTPQIEGLPEGAIVRPLPQEGQPKIEGLPAGAIVRPIAQNAAPQEKAAPVQDESPKLKSGADREGLLKAGADYNSTIERVKREEQLFGQLYPNSSFSKGATATWEAFKPELPQSQDFIEKNTKRLLDYEKILMQGIAKGLPPEHRVGPTLPPNVTPPPPEVAAEVSERRAGPALPQPELRPLPAAAPTAGALAPISAKEAPTSQRQPQAAPQLDQGPLAKVIPPKISTEFTQLSGLKPADIDQAVQSALGAIPQVKPAPNKPEPLLVSPTEFGGDPNRILQELKRQLSSRKHHKKT